MQIEKDGGLLIIKLEGENGYISASLVINKKTDFIELQIRKWLLDAETGHYEKKGVDVNLCSILGDLPNISKDGHCSQARSYNLNEILKIIDSPNYPNNIESLE